MHHVIATPRLISLDRRKFVVGYHWPYPGLGDTERKDTGYAFVTV